MMSLAIAALALHSQSAVKFGVVEVRLDQTGTYANTYC